MVWVRFWNCGVCCRGFYSKVTIFSKIVALDWYNRLKNKFRPSSRGGELNFLKILANEENIKDGKYFANDHKDQFTQYKTPCTPQDTTALNNKQPTVPHNKSKQCRNLLHKPNFKTLVIWVQTPLLQITTHCKM